MFGEKTRIEKILLMMERSERTRNVQNPVGIKV